jgi:hypothetical protein
MLIAHDWMASWRPTSRPSSQQCNMQPQQECYPGKIWNRGNMCLEYKA